jgi:pimeloyl-[acyl-carrier protein] methyl ester esterase
MPLTLLFCHGWGFDARVWDPLAACLGEFAQVRDDAGYFAAPSRVQPGAPTIAVAHSFGTMRFLAAPPPGLVGLVSIAGFDRFTAADTFPGMPRRVVDRMIGAFAQEPETVLADFRIRCGAYGAVPPFATEPLMRDLGVLRDGDVRQAAAALAVPVLSLQAGHDAILPLAMRESVFASAGHVVRRTHASAGHLLPCDDPDWCAEAIRGFVGSLT